MSAAAGPQANGVALVDGASFVLPYDHGLAGALAAGGRAVTVFASDTRYNAAFLEALRSLPGVQVEQARVSGSVVPRWRGVPGYIGLLLRLWRQRRRFAIVNLQFSVMWPLELPLFALLRRHFVFTVHNAVPHGHAARTHRPTAWLAALARRLVFASEATRDDFMRRYGAKLAAKAVVLRHGLLPAVPGAPRQPYSPPVTPEALVFWGTVKPYKGVELLADLARDPAWAAAGLALEVHGRWDASLAPLQAELRALGVTVVDDYLDGPALLALLRRPVVFLLPYRAATQSGAFYTLLHHGCRFLCADTGDLGALLRRHGLHDLLLAERTPAAVLQALQRLQAGGTALAARLQQAQDDCTWSHTLAEGAAAYEPWSA